MQACLTKDPKERPSAEELLHHDWLVRQLEAETAGIPEVRPLHNHSCTDKTTLPFTTIVTITQCFPACAYTLGAKAPAVMLNGTVFLFSVA